MLNQRQHYSGRCSGDVAGIGACLLFAPPFATGERFVLSGDGKGYRRPFPTVDHAALAGLAGLSCSTADTGVPEGRSSSVGGVLYRREQFGGDLYPLGYRRSAHARLNPMASIAARGEMNRRYAPRPSIRAAPCWSATQRPSVWS